MEHAEAFTAGQSARPQARILQRHPGFVARDVGHFDDKINIARCLVFKKRRGITVELTRRRESKHHPPHQV
jgi:hypothetical protein